MSKERYVEHTVACELPIRDSVTKGNYNLADIETKYLPIQTEVVSDNKYKTINKLQQQIAELKQQLADLEAKLAESEEKKESYRLQNEHHHLQLLQFYSRLGVEAFGADIHEKALETLMIMKEQLAESEEQLKEELVEKKGLERALSACNRQNDEFADMIKKLVSEKEELKQQHAKKKKELAYMTEQAKKFNNEAQKYFEDAYCNDFHNQDKISFAIQQLEKVKEFVNDIYGEYSASVITNFIDNQIKQLKGE